MKRVTYIISEIDKSLGFEWLATHLNRAEIQLDFILLNRGDSHLESFLKDRKIPVKRIKLKSGMGMLQSFVRLFWTLYRNRPDIIHTHLRFGTFFGISAGYLSGVKHRIHTRHHAAFNHTYFPHAVKYDRWVNRFSTRIVSISDVVTEVLTKLEDVPVEKIVKIHHGFDLSLFENPNSAKVASLRKIYLNENSAPVIGVISRYLELKGIPYVIEAFKIIRNEFPNAHLILANTTGSYSSEIHACLASLSSDSYTEIKFEQDIASLYQLFDVFVHVPVSRTSEAFGQTYVEALAAGIPSVFTSTGVACEIIHDRENAVLVNYRNTNEIVSGIKEILDQPLLRNNLIENGKKTALSFNLPNFINRIERLYLETESTENA